MKKYLFLLKYELKTIFKDATNRFLIIYPLLMILICGVILPLALEQGASGDTKAVTLMIALAVCLSIGSFVSGGMLGFIFIENKDEKTILNIAVTPIKIRGYIWFKVAYTYVLSIIGNFILVGALKLFFAHEYVIEYGGMTIELFDNLTWLHITVFILTSSLFVPTVVLLIGTLAKNKIEGFALMKSTGLIIMIPILSLLNAFQDWKQYLLGITPNFWPVKAMLNVALQFNDPSNLNYYVYMAISVAYSILLAGVALKIFIKRSQLN